MTPTEPRPVTTDERALFDRIRRHPDVGLVSVLFDGQPTAAIAHMDVAAGEIFPLAVLVTPEMFARLTPPGPAEVIHAPVS